MMNAIYHGIPALENGFTNPASFCNREKL